MFEVALYCNIALKTWGIVRKYSHLLSFFSHQSSTQTMYNRWSVIGKGLWCIIHFTGTCAWYWAAFGLHQQNFTKRKITGNALVFNINDMTQYSLQLEVVLMHTFKRTDLVVCMLLKCGCMHVQWSLQINQVTGNKNSAYKVWCCSWHIVKSLHLLVTRERKSWVNIQYMTKDGCVHSQPNVQEIGISTNTAPTTDDQIASYSSVQFSSKYSHMQEVTHFEVNWILLFHIKAITKKLILCFTSLLLLLARYY